MNVKEQTFCLWLLPIFAIVTAISFWGVAGLKAPISPALTANEVAELYRQNSLGIQSAIAIGSVTCALPLPFFMVVVAQMQRMKGLSNALPYSYLAYAISGFALICVSLVLFGATAFRQHSSPEATQLFNDLAWYACLIIPTGIFSTQSLILAAAIYLDRSETPVFPRWVGHLNVGIALTTLPGLFAINHMTGSFAVDGPFTFHMRLALYAAYFAIMFVQVRNAVRNQSALAVTTT